MSKYLGMDFYEILCDAAYRLDAHFHSLEMYSWPETFGSTSGPRKGIGGAAMTTFQVYAFRIPGKKEGVKFCHGVSKPWNGEFMECWK